MKSASLHEICKNFYFAVCFRFWNYFFLIRHHKLSLNRFQTDSNSKTVLVAALQLTLIWSRRGRFCKPIYFFHVRDKDQYFISFYSSYHGSKSYASFFFLFFLVSRKNVFTGMIEKRARHSHIKCTFYIQIEWKFVYIGKTWCWI